jgi:diguanylate cyclase (GGDEF)-like protein
VTLSVGVAAFPEHGNDHHTILEQADLALYRAKDQGKNRVCQMA